MIEKRRVADATEMLPLVELTEIRVYEVAGRRATATDDSENRVVGESLAISAQGSNTWFETRAKMIVRTEDADLVAHAGAVFTFAEPLEVPEAVAAEFVEKVGVMAVFPFLREQVYASASRLGVAPPVVGLLRAGGFRIEPPGTQTVES